jgi:hypothetical protein
MVSAALICVGTVVTGGPLPRISMKASRETKARGKLANDVVAGAV